MEDSFDCFVIGGGSGGVRAAKLGALAGKKVGLAEEFRYGGTCVIRGCVPKKLMLFASDFRQSFNDSLGFGWNANNLSFDWKSFRQRKDEEINRLENIYLNGLKDSGVKTFRSRAQLMGNSKVLLSSGEIIKSPNIIIATGGRPANGEFIGSELSLTSNEIMDLDSLPKKLIIFGGGYIACEFATIFNGMGSDVTLIYRGGQVLRGFDSEVTSLVQSSMIERGIEIKLETVVTKAETWQSDNESGVAVHISNGEVLKGSELITAIGRTPNTENLGLEAAGVLTDTLGAVLVDEYQQTNVEGVYAIGDVTNRINLTPVAIRDGVAVMKTIIEGKPSISDHSLVPSAVFTRPEIGTIGLTEEEALLAGEIKVYRALFRPMYNSLANSNEKCLMKMIVEKNSEKILGIHLVGMGAAELIQLAAVSVKKGATKKDFDQTVAVHPTLAEELVTLK